jgi:4-hydroxythreonine-4-phosphate dehydrogenase
MKARLAITMGDPAGIGAELILKAFSREGFSEKYDCLLIGEKTVLEFYKKLLKTDLPKIKLLDLNIVKNDFEVGKVSKKCGEAAFKYIEKAIDLAKNGEVDAVVTCPINKEALWSAGYNYPGHTEIFAQKFGVKKYTMLFKLENVSVVHCTTHCSLRDAINSITEEKIFENILLLNNALRSFGIKNPRIAVAGLNPHAGENGLFGNEEIDYIIPAINRAKLNGINASGAFPPDTVFASAFDGNYDGVVSMLHDHGFVALKSRNFSAGVNITIGLPIIRSSVGHGTAFDIAGKNLANENSLLAAIDIADKMAKLRSSSNSH